MPAGVLHELLQIAAQPDLALENRAHRIGPLTGDGSGILIMAIVGGAIIPVLEGVLADRIGIQHAFILPAICYLYIVYYALRGSRPVVPLAAPTA